MYALIHLLYDGALRIQDAVGLTFGDIILVKPDANGHRYIDIISKKTKERTITITEPCYTAIKRYQEELSAPNTQVMFKSTVGDDPANRWVKALQRFFRKHNLGVKSHDFRTTFATHFYNSHKNIK